MFAKIRRVKNGQVAKDAEHHDIVTLSMEKLSGTIQKVRPYSKYGYSNWFTGLTGIKFSWHRSWLNFHPRLTFKCLQCGEKIRIRIDLEKVDNLRNVELRNPVKCKKCHSVFSFVDINVKNTTLYFLL